MVQMRSDLILGAFVCFAVLLSSCNIAGGEQLDSGAWTSTAHEPEQAQNMQDLDGWDDERKDRRSSLGYSDTEYDRIRLETELEYYKEQVRNYEQRELQMLNELLGELTKATDASKWWQLVAVIAVSLIVSAVVCLCYSAKNRKVLQEYLRQNNVKVDALLKDFKQQMRESRDQCERCRVVTDQESVPQKDPLTSPSPHIDAPSTPQQNSHAEEGDLYRADPTPDLMRPEVKQVVPTGITNQVEAFQQQLNNAYRLRRKKAPFAFMRKEQHILGLQVANQDLLLNGKNFNEIVKFTEETAYPQYVGIRIGDDVYAAPNNYTVSADEYGQYGYAHAFQSVDNQGVQRITIMQVTQLAILRHLGDNTYILQHPGQLELIDQ